MIPKGEEAALAAARDAFIAEWGVVGNAWGINRTMAQIHALLLVTKAPLTTDEVMEELKISRGNAHGNLRELIGWGLVRSVIRKGERKELFEAEKDVWKIFCTVARERRRREIEPALATLQACQEKTKALKTPDARAFHAQIRELADFAALANAATDRISQAEKSALLPFLLKFLGRKKA